MRLTMRTLGFHQAEVDVVSLSGEKRKSCRFIRNWEIDWVDQNQDDVGDWR